MKTLTTLALTLLATSSLLAQKAAPIDVKIDQVNDRRTSGSFSSLSIKLELPKIKSSDVSASRVLVAAATDSTGRNLVDPQNSEPMLEPNVRNMIKGPAAAGQPETASVSVTLVNPDRKATTVKELRGEIELFMPGKDPNSIAEIAKFLSFSGKPLTHKALKANGVEITLISTAQLEAERKRYADAKRKEYKDMGYEDGESLDSMVQGMLDSLLQVEENDVIVRIKDPNHRIQDIEYIDAAGDRKNVSMREEEGLVHLSTWEGKPQPDWKLNVSMKTPKNLVRYSFGLKDVLLP